MKTLPLKTFYGCWGLRAGALATGYLGLLLGVIFFAYNIFVRFEMRRILRGETTLTHFYMDIAAHFKEYTSYVLTQKVVTAYMFVRSLFLIIGIYRKKLNFIEDWLSAIIFYALIAFTSHLYIVIMLTREDDFTTELVKAVVMYAAAFGGLHFLTNNLGIFLASFTKYGT